MKKVLVAEDEESIREFIVINLTRSGYNVEQAENGAVALEKFSQDETGFDVAILDIMMPELDGLSVCKELRKRSSDLGIIMLSAKTQEMDKVTPCWQITPWCLPIPSWKKYCSRCSPR